MAQCFDGEIPGSILVQFRRAAIAFASAQGGCNAAHALDPHHNRRGSGSSPRIADLVGGPQCGVAGPSLRTPANVFERLGKELEGVAE